MYEPSAQMEEQIEQAFKYHTPFGDQAERYQALRSAAKGVAHLIVNYVPPSREQSLAITHLEAAIMFANAAIARHEIWEDGRLVVERPMASRQQTRLKELSRDFAELAAPLGNPAVDPRAYLAELCDKLARLCAVI